MHCLQPHEPLATSRLLLRPITPADGLTLFEYMKTDWYGLALTGVPVTITEHGVELPWTAEQVERAYTQFSADEQRAMFAVVLPALPEHSSASARANQNPIGENAAGTVIGEVVLNEYDDEHHSCNLRAYIAPKWRARGYGREALEALISYGFERGLSAITLEVYDHNSTARQLYDKLGFLPVGYESHAVEIAGISYGATTMQLTREDYHADTRALEEEQVSCGNLELCCHLAHSYAQAPTEQIHLMLREFNRQHFETLDGQELAVWLTDQGKLVGGVYGEVFGHWLEVEYLVVAPGYRKKGLGSLLLARIEQAGLKAGAKQVLLNTFGFQGKLFYPRFGYHEIGRIEGYPLTGTQHWFVKRLN